MQYDCLIVDDEQGISETICEYFNMFDFSSTFVTSYAQGIAFLSKYKVSLVLLDVNLGNESGFLFCKEVRKTSNIPIIFISARAADEDILSGFAIGGDEYVTKPFSMSVLLAKAKSMIKRSATIQELSDVIVFNDIRIEKSSARVSKADKLIKLKPLEWRLLLYLFEHQNKVISKDALLSNVWGTEFVNEGTLSVHIRHLREKLEDDPNNPQLIKTAWGMGYICETNGGTSE